MRSGPAVALLVSCIACSAWVVAEDDAEDPPKTDKRLEACREVVREVLGMKEDVPRDLIQKAECVAVIPGVKKAALGFGARFGYGAALCRTKSGSWGPPLMVSLKGGSLGLQIGGQEADLVLLFMNPKGMDYLLRSKFTLGGDASIAAGPVGRSAEAATDAQMRAEILSYSHSRGVFAGISLEGAVLKADEGANEYVYGRKVLPRALLMKVRQTIPPPAQALVDELNALAPR